MTKQQELDGIRVILQEMCQKIEQFFKNLILNFTLLCSIGYSNWLQHHMRAKSFVVLV